MYYTYCFYFNYCKFFSLKKIVKLSLHYQICLDSISYNGNIVCHCLHK